MLASWARPYQPLREEFWPEVSRFFAGLPAPLFRQGLLLQDNLAAFCSPTGRFSGILTRDHDHPLLYLHFWLLDDLPLPSSAPRRSLQKNLFLAAVFAFAGLAARQMMQDESSHQPDDGFFLAQTLLQQSCLYLTRLFPPDSAFWTFYHRAWQETAAACLPLPPGEVPSLARAAGQMACAKITPAAVLHAANQTGLLPDLCRLVDHLNTAHQVMSDLLNLHRDLRLARLSYPLAGALRVLGVDPAQIRTVRLEQVLAALALSDVVPALEADSRQALAEAADIARRLSLPTTAAHLSAISGQIQTVTARFNVRAKTRPPKMESSPPKPPPFVDPLPAAIRMAEGYLLSDPDFRECWEVQRRAAFGQVEMTARVFPVGLVVEILCRRGHPLGQTVSALFRQARDTGFRYFDYPGMPPDTDDLALLLRLWPYSPSPDRHRQWLAQPLARLQQNLRPDGGVPVWLTAPDFAPDGPFPVLWGQTCAAVETNLLLGLLDFDPASFAPLIEQTAAHLLGLWQSEGMAAVRHYAPLYALWVGLELVDRLRRSSQAAVLADTATALSALLADRLAVEARRPQPSPQEAAFLALACLSAGASTAVKTAFDRGWITRLLQTQRYDGSWAGEPLYPTPTRGDFAAWYHSRMVTTAFCYEALVRYAEK